MRRLMIGGCLTVLLLVTTVSGRWSMPAAGGTAAPPAATPADCSGLLAYSRTMLQVGNHWRAQMRTDDLFDRDPASFTAPEMLAAAQHDRELQTELRAIPPPDVVAAWHAAEVLRFGRAAADLRAAATGLPVATPADSDPATIARQEREARALAETACSAFTVFADQWDAMTGNASATPTASASA